MRVSVSWVGAGANGFTIINQGVPMSILIRGGTVVNHDHSKRADVLIEDGKIVSIGQGLQAPKGVQIIDADGAYVMPGGIDPHTHLDFPTMGNATADNFESGTTAALAGGTTTVIDFCVPRPGQSMLEAYHDWQQKAETAKCDFGFHMTVTWWDKQLWDEMEIVVNEYGINSFKHFLAYKDVLMVNDHELYHSFTRCAALGAIPLVHAENGDIIERLQETLFKRGVTGPEGHAYSRPPEVEGEATTRAIMIADMAEVPLYVVHTSCSQAHEAIARARAAGQRVYGEPLIQHLLLDDSEYLNKDWDYAAERVMSPPFRDKSHQDSLWNGLKAGSLQVVASDHSVFTRAQKQIGRDDFRKIPNGTGAVEDRMIMLWNAGVNTSRLTVEEFVAVTSSNIARILNIFPQKGSISVGADADILIWDPAATKTVSAKTQHSRIEINLFEGENVKGLPVTVISQGRVAVQNNEVVANKGSGRYLKRKPFNSIQVANLAWKEKVRPAPVVRFDIVP